MKLYEVTNGYQGESYVRCLVIAENVEQALELARPKFEAAGRHRHDSDYWTELTAELFCDDTAKPWAGSASDGYGGPG